MMGVGQGKHLLIAFRAAAIFLINYQLFAILKFIIFSLYLGENPIVKIENFINQGHVTMKIVSFICD